jgi:hypothetical protein
MDRSETLVYVTEQFGFVVSIEILIREAGKIVLNLDTVIG